jgi:transcriptional regulator with XRE-family HTH domain
MACAAEGTSIHVGEGHQMTDDAWKDRLQTRMHDLKLTMKSLSLAAGLGETGVRDMLKRTQSPSIDAMAKVAKELGMSLTELWDGPTPDELRVVRILGETGTSGSTWFEIHHQEIIVLNQLGHRVRVEMSSDVAVYDHRDIVIYEKIPFQLVDAGDSKNHLLMTKAGARYVGPVRRGTRPGRLALIAPEGEITLTEPEIAWIAKWKRAIPKRLM